MLLKRYVLKTFSYFYLLAICGFIGAFLVGDFFERVDEFISKGTPLWEMVTYYLLKIPFIFFFMGPQAVLLATVLAIASLAKTNEITAMKACGISVTRIALPLVGASILIALGVLACNEYITPETSKKMNYIYYVKVHGRASYGMIENNKIWYKSQNGFIWNIENYDHKNSILLGVGIFSVKDGETIEKRIDAEKAVWIDNRWEFQNGSIRTFDADGLESTEFFDTKYFLVPETPSNFEVKKVRPEEMSIKNMYEEIVERAAQGKDVTGKWVDLNYKLSYPFIGIVMALIAIPLSLRTSRNGGVLFSVAMNLAMGVSFSFIYAMFVSLGRSGTFSPVLATWGPITLFTAVGFYMLLTIDSERSLPFIK